jgi:3-deoxy-D-manno-octulosonic-acid transferase
MELEATLNELSASADQLVGKKPRQGHGPDQNDLLGRVMFGLYNFVLVLTSPLVVAVLLYKKRCRTGLRQRLGHWPSTLTEVCQDGKTLWVHAVSMGEVNAVTPLVHELRSRYPDHRIIVSTVTETGKETVHRNFEGLAHHVYFPLDFTRVVRRALQVIRPRLVVVVETELWPNFLRAAAGRGVPCVLVNGRISTDSFHGYRRLRPFFRRVVQSFSLCLMQTPRDVHRIVELGADPATVVLTGNLKFDHQASADATKPPIDLSLHAYEELFVAGSTHALEEEAILECYRRLLECTPQLVLVIAPRHIDRVGAIAETVRNYGFPVLQRTQLPNVSLSHGPRVILLDTLGELAALYEQATVVFVGGSLVPVGGHNPLEPASRAKAVLFGPYMDHFADVADLLVSHGGSIQVENSEQMAVALTGLLNDRAWLQDMGQRAKHVVQANQGTVLRSADHIAELLKMSSVSQST